ncbi:hypothetical protein RDABS01_018246 [Bienertia sinuspersici]
MENSQKTDSSSNKNSPNDEDNPQKRANRKVKRKITHLIFDKEQDAINSPTEIAHEGANKENSGQSPSICPPHISYKEMSGGNSAMNHPNVENLSQTLLHDPIMDEECDSNYDAPPEGIQDNGKCPIILLSKEEKRRLRRQLKLALIIKIKEMGPDNEPIMVLTAWILAQGKDLEGQQQVEATKFDDWMLVKKSGRRSQAFLAALKEIIRVNKSVVVALVKTHMGGNHVEIIASKIGLKLKEFIGKEWDSQAPLVPFLGKFAEKLQAWSKNVFNNIFQKKKELMAQIGGIQRKQATNYERGLVKLEAKLRKELDNVLYQEEFLCYQKSQAECIQDGDRNTAFFHLSSILRRWRNKVVPIRNDDGTWLSDPEDVPRVVCDAIDKRTRGFIWGDMEDHRKLHLISWERIQEPKKKWGIRNKLNEIGKRSISYQTRGIQDGFIKEMNLQIWLEEGLVDSNEVEDDAWAYTFPLACWWIWKWRNQFVFRNAIHAELKALRLGLQLAWERGFKKLNVRMDNNAEANHAADWLANEGVRQQEKTIVFDHPPSGLSKILIEDVIRVA